MVDAKMKVELAPRLTETIIFCLLVNDKESHIDVNKIIEMIRDCVNNFISPVEAKSGIIMFISEARDNQIELEKKSAMIRKELFPNSFPSVDVDLSGKKKC